jgi:hypothetical protein
VTAITESTVESAALAWLESLGRQVVHGPDIAPNSRPTSMNAKIEFPIIRAIPEKKSSK